MKRSRFSEVQFADILKEAAGGVPVADVLRQHNISTATYYAWRANTAAWKPPNLSASGDTKL
ncbi:MAG: transposase [Myxococcales bacterium]|nr:transposase [Myxococcales bacterium]